MNRSTGLLLAIITLFLSTTIAGQTNTGEIAGIVRDTSGGVLAGATVTAKHAASGVIVERTTDTAGRFLFPGLRIGAWDITATLSGFAPQTQRGVALEIGRTLNLEFGLNLGALSEEVTVESTAPLLQTTSAEISDVIGNQEVVQLPLNGRSFIALAQLSDSVVIPPGGTRGESLQQAGPLPNVGGQRSGHNIYLLDGVKVTDELFNNLVINPSVDSVEEFKIQKSMYPAEFGGKASALINVATKAGGNQFHGSVFEFHRNDALDSPNFFQPKDQPLPPLRQNQFGGALGGPLVRDRTFFFGSYEGQRMRRSLTRTFSVPTAAARAGDFSAFPTICDPLTIPVTGTCTPFAGNRIPDGRIDPIAKAFLEQVPRRLRPRRSRTSPPPKNRTASWIKSASALDHRLTNSDQLFARFSTFDADELQPFGTSALQEPWCRDSADRSRRARATSSPHTPMCSAASF